MDIEGLKLILETISSAGESAKVIAIVWICKEMIVYLLGYAFGIVIAVIAAKCIRNGIMEHSLSSKIAAIVGTDTDTWYSGARKSLISRITDMAEKEKVNK